MIRPRGVAAVLASVLLLAACGTVPPGDTASPAGSTAGGHDSGPPPGEHQLSLWLPFDELPEGPLAPGTPVKDSSGLGNDAAVVMPEPDSGIPDPSVVPDAPGSAVRFAEPCDKGPDCVRGILEVKDDPGLSPGSADFSYGADLRLRLEDLRGGSNVVQKGFSTGEGGQWKLQVDDARGFPSCILVDSGSGEIVRVLGDRTVADGSWHRTICERSGDAVTLTVDGQVSGLERARSTPNIANTAPVRVAGKHVKPDGDFYFGDVDNVFLRIAG